MRMGEPASGNLGVQQRRPHTQDRDDCHQQECQRPGVMAHARFKHAFGLDQQPGAAQQRISNDQAQAAKQWKWRKPVKSAAHEHPIDHWNPSDVCANRDALAERCQQGATDKGHIPDMASCGAGLEAKLERHATKDQPRQHEHQRQVQRFQDHRVGQWKRPVKCRATEYQPGFVTVPDRCDGVHHHIALLRIRDQWEKNAQAQVEAIHDDVHHHAKGDDDAPNQR
ncbi:hypothetical protein D3C81_1422130 [compost metagenome]